MVGPIDASAGAITSANSTGVSNGTSNSRGVRALSASRRCVSVVKADSVPVAFGCSRRTATGVRVTVEADMDRSSFRERVGVSGGEGVAGKAEVDVVERWRSGARRGGGEASVANGGEHGVGAPGAYRDRHRRADRERVVAGDAVAAQARERDVRVAVDTELQHLVAERGKQVGRPVERNDAPGVHDADAIAQPLRLVE